MLDPKECFKTHPLLHLFSGAGVGLLLAAYVPYFGENLVMSGLILLFLGVALEFALLRKSK